MYTMIQNYSVYRTLKAFMDYPLRGFGMRDLCRHVKLGPPSIINNLKKLRDNGFVVEKKVYGRKLYFANRESRLFRLYKQFNNLLEIEESGLLDFLNEQFSFPTIVLFGSKSSGEDTEQSDMDVAVLTNSKKQTDLEKYETKLRAKIHILILGDKDIKRMKYENKELLNNIINGRVLAGYLKVF